jgi:hypothetical protein
MIPSIKVVVSTKKFVAWRILPRRILFSGVEAISYLCRQLISGFDPVTKRGRSSVVEYMPVFGLKYAANMPLRTFLCVDLVLGGVCDVSQGETRNGGGSRRLVGPKARVNHLQHDGGVLWQGLRCKYRLIKMRPY